MAQYLERTLHDDSGVTLELYNDIESIPHRCPNTSSVPMHRHHFYELTLILRGSCEHFYRGTRTPLLPGDIFLIPPDHAHAFSFHENISFCNCQFDRAAYVGSPEALLIDIAYSGASTASLTQKQLRDINAIAHERNLGKDITLSCRSHANAQGIIHLDHTEADYVFCLLKKIQSEQDEQKYGFERMKRNLLEQAITLAGRAQLQQTGHVTKQSSWKDTLIDDVLTLIDQNLTQEIDFESISSQQGITLTYFRTLFKSATGFSPTEYVNRARVLRALTLLQTTDAPVSEVALQVGILDANYFSRIFKKIVGYPPSYFKSIQPPKM